MLMALLLWAQEQKEVERTDPGWAMFVPLIAIFVLFYFLLIRPAQRRERMMREMVDKNIKKNVEVVTSAGIIGVVTHIKDNGEEVTIKIDDNAKMRVLRSCIVRILSPVEGDKPAEKTDTSIQVKK